MCEEKKTYLLNINITFPTNVLKHCSSVVNYSLSVNNAFYEPLIQYATSESGSYWWLILTKQPVFTEPPANSLGWGQAKVTVRIHGPANYCNKGKSDKGKMSCQRHIFN